MARFIGTTFRITYYSGPLTRFSYVLATNQLEAERLAEIYRHATETIFRVAPFED
jgi:hypothetical protein